MPVLLQLIAANVADADVVAVFVPQSAAWACQCGWTMVYMQQWVRLLSQAYLNRVRGSRRTRLPLEACSSRHLQACAFRCGLDLVCMRCEGPGETCAKAME